MTTTGIGRAAHGLSFARPLSNQIFGAFTPSLSDAANFIEDTPAFRREVFGSFVLAYLFSFLSFAALPLLPDQKAHTQELKRSSSSGPRFGYASVALFASTFTYSLVLIFLTMFPSTACLRLVGGSGCDHGD